jgi:predicted flap endonuclease-1-like 5' DNA nuclease
MTTIMRAAAAAALCLGLAACGGGDDENAASQSEELEPPTESSAQQSAPEVQNIPRPEQTMAAGRLSPVNNSGVTGSVNIRGIGEQTEVSLNVTGITQGNQQLQGSIVQGTCEQSGAEVVPVGPIPVGAGNIASLTDTLQVPVGTVLNGQHALIIKGQNAGPATPPLACSPLPQWERLPPVG